MCHSDLCANGLRNDFFISRVTSVLSLNEVPRKLGKRKIKPADEYIMYIYTKSPGGSRTVPRPARLNYNYSNYFNISKKKNKLSKKQCSACK